MLLGSLQKQNFISVPKEFISPTDPTILAFDFRVTLHGENSLVVLSSQDFTCAIAFIYSWAVVRCQDHFTALNRGNGTIMFCESFDLHDPIRLHFLFLVDAFLGNVTNRCFHLFNSQCTDKLFHRTTFLKILQENNMSGCNCAIFITIFQLMGILIIQ